MAADATPALLYVPALPEPGVRLTLGAEESRYVARVCRARAGESVEATDGRGARATLRLLEVRDDVVAEVLSVARTERARTAWLLCGAPEGERADWLIEKLAELGVARFVPVDCQRSSWTRASGRMPRWRRLVVAALRQSRRSHLMALEEPAPLPQALARIEGAGPRWLADEAGAPPATGTGDGTGPAIGLVGPAEGLSREERSLALEAGFEPVRLSDARLRCETAALALAAWWSGSL